MNCTICGNQMVNDYTTFMVMRDEAIYVTEEVPCLKCPICEHIAFAQEVAKKLERYSSGRVLPSATYKTWVFKWGAPVEIPQIIYPPTFDINIPMEGTPAVVAVFNLQD